MQNVLGRPQLLTGTVLGVLTGGLHGAWGSPCPPHGLSEAVGLQQNGLTRTLLSSEHEEEGRRGWDSPSPACQHWGAEPASPSAGRQDLHPDPSPWGALAWGRIPYPASSCSWFRRCCCVLATAQACRCRLCRHLGRLHQTHRVNFQPASAGDRLGPVLNTAPFPPVTSGKQPLQLGARKEEEALPAGLLGA